MSLICMVAQVIVRVPEKKKKKKNSRYAQDDSQIPLLVIRESPADYDTQTSLSPTLCYALICHFVHG